MKASKKTTATSPLSDAVRRHLRQPSADACRGVNEIVERARQNAEADLAYFDEAYRMLWPLLLSCVVLSSDDVTVYAATETVFKNVNPGGFDDGERSLETVTSVDDNNAITDYICGMVNAAFALGVSLGSGIGGGR